MYTSSPTILASPSMGVKPNQRSSHSGANRRDNGAGGPTCPGSPTLSTSPLDRKAGDADDDNVMHLVGPPMWETLHYAAYQCPEPFIERAHALVGLARGYAALLPCAECRGHFSALLEAHPPEIAAQQGREGFARWTVDAHNAVNARLGKPLFTYDQAARRYARSDLRCNDPDRSVHVTRGRLSTMASATIVAVVGVVLATVVALLVAWLYMRDNSKIAYEKTSQPDGPTIGKRFGDLSAWRVLHKSSTC